MKNIPLIALLFVATPSFAEAQATQLTFEGLVRVVIGYINLIVPVLASLAAFIMIAGAVRYMLSVGDSANYRRGVELILWGVIGLFVIFSVWGLVNLGASVLGLTSEVDTCVQGADFC